MVEDRISNEYFEWIFNMMCEKRYSNDISFRKLFTRLYDTEFRYSLSRDEDRACDGRDLRYRFAYYNDYDHEDVKYTLDTRPCSVLEMMVALAIRCEEDIMDDPEIGDRTRQWFWTMVANLGLGSMSDDKFNVVEVDSIVERFLLRKYKPNGDGGLFYIRNTDRDLRKFDLWYQLCWYLDSIV